MLKIGLTGSIATGKSTVLKMFEDLGVPVFSSDAAVHKLYAGAAAAPIERLFPGVAPNGVVDRTELSRRLLAEPEKLTEIEAVVHPLVRNEVAYFFKAAEGRGAPLAVADIPLLFERGFDYGLDAVIVTVVDESVQRQRALARPGMSVEKLDAILARQMPQAEKRERADHVIDTSVSIEATEREVRDLVDRLKAAGKTE
jgi:dephospho-CoA kinase